MSSKSQFYQIVELINLINISHTTYNMTDEFNDECDDLPFFSLNRPELGDFEMPDAEVVASQRTFEAEQDMQIKRMRAEISAAVTAEDSESDEEIANCLNSLKVEPPTLSMHENPGYMPSSLEFLKPSLKEKQYEFLANFMNCLQNGENINLDSVLDNVLICIEGALSRKQKWKPEELLCLTVALSLLCISRKSQSHTRHLPQARTFLNYLVNDMCKDSHLLNKIGKTLCDCIKDPQDRLDLANVLDSGNGYNGYNLCTGLVRMALEDLLSENSGGNEWSHMPLSHSELLNLAMKSWKDLSIRYKLITTHLISKNLTQLESMPEILTNNKHISPEGSTAELFSFFLNADNGSKELKMADKLKLQILLTRIQLFHNIKTSTATP